MKENTGAVHAQVPVDVASFLLNEKRAEILKLEGRLKVNIVLVPNAHLETPHYKVQRLKHDELNQMEHVPASYELVEQPEEPKAEGKDADPKRERQQAAVQGIVPDQPAPVVPEPQAKPVAPAPAPVAAAAPAPAPAATEAQKSGFLGRLFGWLKADKPADQPAAANEPSMATPKAAAPSGPSGERRDRGEHRRGERGGDRGRDRDRGGRRDGRGDRQEHRGEHRDGGRRDGRDGRRDGQRHEGRRDGQPRQEGQQRNDGQPRHNGQHRQQGRQEGRQEGQPRVEPQAMAQPQEQVTAQVEGASAAPLPAQNHGPRPEGQQGPRPEGEGGERRRRRRRGGRGRNRDHGAEGVAPGAESGSELAQAETPVEVLSIEEQQRREHQIQQEREAREEARRQREAAREAAAASAPEPVRTEAPAVTPVEAPAPAPAPSPAPAVRAEAPKMDAKAVLADSGLQMVETDRSKAVSAPVEPEPVKLGRPRRERPAQAVQEELVQVETRDK